MRLENKAKRVTKARTETEGVLDLVDHKDQRETLAKLELLVQLDPLAALDQVVGLFLFLSHHKTSQVMTNT